MSRPASGPPPGGSRGRAADGILSGVDTACSLCGTRADGSTLTWVLERDERGRDRWLCPDCARAHVRDIEARLSTDWW